MSENGRQLQSEDQLSFLSAVFGALGSTLTQQTSSQTVFFGLCLAAVSKTLPSLSDKKTRSKDWKEDLALLVATFLSFLAAGLQSGWSFSNPSSLVYALLLIGVLLKAVLSLKGPRREWKAEDVASLALALITLAIIPLASQYAPAGVFLSFLAKTLLPSSSDGQHKK